MTTARPKASPQAAQPVRTPQAAGWLSITALVGYVTDELHLPVTRRGVERWLRHPTEPLPSILVGGRRMVHKADLTRWLGRGRRGEATLPGAA